MTLGRFLSDSGGPFNFDCHFDLQHGLVEISEFEVERVESRETAVVIRVAPPQLADLPALPRGRVLFSPTVGARRYMDVATTHVAAI